MEKQFEFGEISERFNTILDDSKKLVSNFNSEIVSDLEKDIEEIQNQKLLTIAFIGQYSAGKSTIISALTGNRSIKIDADIATDSTTDYAWNNVLLTDTPGLFTDREDHDEITYKKIKESDLLIYCLTSDLFDDIILNNFNKIAFDELQKNKMMVVVNKMSMESGDYDELVKNYKITLNNSLKPNSFDDFPSCFIDAADYLEGISDKEEDLINLSHFDNLVVLLNKFIEEKGIWGKLSTPIYRTISFIDNAILSEKSKDNKEFLDIVNRMEKAIINKKDLANNRANSIINNLSSTIISYSNQIISKIGVEDINFDSVQRNVQSNIQRDTEEAQTQLQELLNSVNNDLDNTIRDIFDTELGEYVVSCINNKTLDITAEALEDFSIVMSNFESISGITKTVAGNVEKFISGGATQAGLFKASQLAGGNQAVEIVKNVGHFFGVKFQPWGAINVAKNIGNVAKVLGPVLSVISVGMEIINFCKEEENARKLSDAKQGCYSEFVGIAKNIERQFNQQLRDYTKETFDRILDQIKDMRSNIINNSKVTNASIEKLGEYQKELEGMLKLASK